MNNHFYKDRSPEETIHKIRTILKENNIVVTENTWYNKSNHYCSLTLGVENTPFSVNGKGVTPLYALASAYGELMERIQNLAIYKLMYNNIAKECIDENEFMFAPDEECINKKEFFQMQNLWLKEQLESVRTNKDDLNNLWLRTSMSQDSDHYVCLPYYCVNTSKVYAIPVVMLAKMYATNGMAAGNTLEEAMVQGLSEIYERYAIKTIIKNKITPGDIPRNEIYKDNLLKDMIERIEQTSRYTLYIKDCSTNLNLPVVAVICVDQNNGYYFVKFGSHPVFSIALQRTLTELLQGQNLHEIRGMSPFEHNEAISCSNENIYQIFLNGCGTYPSEFFKDNPNYSLDAFKDAEVLSNKDMLKNMFNDLKSRGFNILVRDVSFLEFPACQIIIPTISEVEDYDNAVSLNRYINYLDLKIQIENVDNLLKQDLVNLADTIYNKENLRFIPPESWLNLKQDNIPWVYKNTYFLVASLYILADDYVNASKTFAEFLNIFAGSISEQESYYFRCASSLLSMLSDKIDLTTIKDILGKFYNTNVIDFAVNDFSKENIYSVFENIKLKENNTKLNELKTLYLKICDGYRRNVIYQGDLKKLFDDLEV